MNADPSEDVSNSLNVNGGKERPIRISSTIAASEKWRDVLCRFSNRIRMNSRLATGLYSLGNPDTDSPVLVTANYRLSLNSLRASLKGRNIWILVIDTKGINVWCAAGKGTFCTKAIVKEITESGLHSLVSHRLLILPQLGASGVAAYKLRKESGYSVQFGPVRASDIPEYLDNGNSATPEMRRVRFSLIDRAKLVPMEALPALGKTALFILIAALLLGITRTGIMYKQAVDGVIPFVIAGLTAVFTGSVLVPLLLPVFPFRKFSYKGFLTGLSGAIILVFGFPGIRDNPFLIALCFVAIPAYSSYLSFLFTGSTTYTSPSGVKKELAVALPFYLASAGISIVLFLLVLIRSWGLL